MKIAIDRLADGVFNVNIDGNELEDVICNGIRRGLSDYANIDNCVEMIVGALHNITESK